MGYNPALITPALKRANNDINVAIQLVSDNTFISSVIEGLKSLQALRAASEANNPTPSTSASAETEVPGPSTATIPGISPSLQRLVDEFELNDAAEEVNPEEMEKSQKAYDALSKDMCSEEDYIDLGLSAETEYLDQYKTLLNI